MSRVRSKDTAPELKPRRAVFRVGLRFRKHWRTLPGTPDLVFVGAKVAVFVDGGFWHGHRFATWREKLTPSLVGADLAQHSSAIATSDEGEAKF